MCIALFLPSTTLHCVGVIFPVSGKGKQPLIPLFFLELAWVYFNFFWFLQFLVDPLKFSFIPAGLPQSTALILLAKFWNVIAPFKSKLPISC
ncbi:hypothetical protein SLEP1_g27597 [Rubroshorea leprosula]|uniref:Uncharacterized protein n=1 Tax=Rubroshorea leprosula TaxID=152421 RepID=A0AAV5JR15_9ROSI|nr:hypothetical protein SLEP1_g27597 [Rubroshorea leprosula]